MTNTDPSNGTVMRWLPCDIQYTGDPALDLGDWVTLHRLYGRRWY